MNVPLETATHGDAVKIRRIVQNLVLNAVKFTRDGGITVSWGDSDPHDHKRWVLSVSDTGPGFHSESGKPLAQALTSTAEAATAAPAPSSPEPARSDRSTVAEAGEGIGLSIVKRLCELLDASIEMKSVANVGTMFRILFPRHYAS